MNAKRRPPDDPREWLNRARSSLAKARAGADIPGVYLEDLCFDAQQAAEKAIKGLLIHLQQDFPYIHDLGELLDRLEKAGQDVPLRIKQVVDLTDYAVATRYPGVIEPVTQEEYEEALAITEEVVHWVDVVVGSEQETTQERC